MDKLEGIWDPASPEALAAHPVVSPEKWLAARRELLKKEKELTRLSEQVARQRQELPWVKVDKEYLFDSTEGKVSLRDLFGHNSQLFVYHFMFGPEWEEGCVGCSFMADHIDGANLHLAHHDVSVIVVSRAPLAKLLAYQKRMNWHFKWVSSFESDFNYDYQASFTKEQLASGKVFYNFEETDLHDSDTESPGSSVFYKDEAGNIFHTYSTYARGGDILLGTHNFLDMTPKGRNEHGTMDWLRRHDKYEDFKGGPDCCCH